MARQRRNGPTIDRPRRVRNGTPPARRSRTRGTATVPADLSDDEVRALLDDNIDPDEMMRIADGPSADEQEASDHDRDTARDRLEGLLLEEDDDL